MARRHLQRTLLDQCVQRAGVHGGAMLNAHLMEWARLSREAGHVLSTLDYSRGAGISERTAWRRRSAARRAFPELPVPALVQLVVRELDRLERDGIPRATTSELLLAS
jgi:hypothetical protein